MTIVTEEDIYRQIGDKAVRVSDAAGRKRLVIRDASVREIAERFSMSIHDVYLAVLSLDICPYRYIRNSEAISVAEQRRLAESHVAVIGAGGLGGHVVTLLARIGIGSLTVVDKDRFDETNLNRQLLSHRESLGRLKADEAASAVAAINPAVAVFSYPVRFDDANADELLTGCHVVVDALDNIHDRFIVERAAERHHIPVVHGAVAGFKGQWMVIDHKGVGFKDIFADDPETESDRQRRENLLGVPAVTPAVVASFQAMEVVGMLLNRGRERAGKVSFLDIERNRFKRYDLGQPDEP